MLKSRVSVCTIYKEVVYCFNIRCYIVNMALIIGDPIVNIGGMNVEGKKDLYLCIK